MWKNKTKREEQPKLAKNRCRKRNLSSDRNDLQSFSKSARFLCAIHDLARGCATRSSVFDRLSMPRVRRRTCFMGLNIANWVKSTRANDPNGSRGHRGRIGLGKRPSNYSEARANRCAGDSSIAWTFAIRNANGGFARSWRVSPRYYTYITDT